MQSLGRRGCRKLFLLFILFFTEEALFDLCAHRRAVHSPWQIPVRSRLPGFLHWGRSGACPSQVFVRPEPELGLGEEQTQPGSGAEEFWIPSVSQNTESPCSAGTRVGASCAAENRGWFGDTKAPLSLSEHSGNASVIFISWTLLSRIKPFSLWPLVSLNVWSLAWEVWNPQEMWEEALWGCLAPPWGWEQLLATLSGSAELKSWSC